MALNDFDYIKGKIRRVTGRPSINQLTDADLIDYINSFLVYDFPLHTRLIYNRQVYSIQLVPRVGVYSIASIKNEYSNFEPPAYIDGLPIQYSQNEQSFYSLYPRLKYSVNWATGSGIAGPYAGSYSYTPITPTTVVISAVDAGGNSLLALDDGVGSFTDQLGAPIVGSTINYLTGAVAGITFTNVIPVGNKIYMSANNYILGKPFTVLYFNNSFHFYPFPDRAYTFDIVAYPNLAATTASGGSLFPDLNQWADTIALGTSLKIFTDNLDLDSYAKVQPLFNEAKRLAERRTLKQLSNQRASTIYDDGLSYPSGWYGYPYQ
jgi:hypothetical protein